MKQTDGCVYVLGSGASLLKLTPAEKEYLQGQITVAMNKYLLFWHIIGVYPDFLFMADDHYPAARVVQESFLLTEQLQRPVHWLLNSLYKDMFGLSAESRAAMHEVIADYQELYGFDYKPELAIEPATYFIKVPAQTYMGWASKLEDRMRAMCGSLTTLLNLLCVLGLGHTIKLLGVDLNTSDSFYDPQYRNRRELHDLNTRIQTSKPFSPHFTAIRWFGSRGVQDDMPIIVDCAAAHGYDIVCCNQESLLVQDGICPYSPIIPT